MKISAILIFLFNFGQFAVSYLCYWKYYKIPFTNNQRHHLISNRQVNNLKSTSIKNTRLFFAMSDKHSSNINNQNDDDDDTIRISNQFDDVENEIKLAQHRIVGVTNDLRLLQIKIDTLMKEIEGHPKLSNIDREKLDKDIKMLLNDKIYLQQSRMILLETKETILQRKIILLQSTQHRENKISFQKSKAGKIFLHIYKLFE